MTTDIQIRDLEDRMHQCFADVLTYEKSTPHLEPAVIAVKLAEVLALRQEIQKFCFDVTPDHAFALMAMDANLDTLLKRIKIMQPASAEGAEVGAARMLPLKDFVETKMVNTRIVSGQDGSDYTCYLNPRSGLTHAGACIIADYYNRRYLGGDRKIVVTTSQDDLIDKISAVLGQDEADIRIGFTAPRNLYSLTGLTSHPTPMILERIHGQVYLYIADSLGRSSNDSWVAKLLPICQKLGIIPMLSSITRQSDNGSCRSEALVYLKNALQLPGTIKAHVVISSVTGVDRQPYGVFRDSPDMLKTSQISASVQEVSEALLHSTKTPKTFSEKLTPYRRSVAYMRADLVSKDGVGSESHPAFKTFAERTYLEQKTQHHYQIIKALLSDPSFSMDVLARITQEACAIPARRAPVLEEPDMLASTAVLRKELFGMRGAEDRDFMSLREALVGDLSGMDLYQSNYSIIDRLCGAGNPDVMYSLIRDELNGISQALESLVSAQEKKQLMEMANLLTQGLNDLQNLSSSSRLGLGSGAG